MKSTMTNDCFAALHKTECEFCLEFSESESSRFALSYAGTTESRIIAKLGGMVVLPTLGQLFEGSLLIMPLTHFETVADMPKEQLAACLRLVSVFSERLSPFGKPVVFEHGARVGTGRACGIYHAHVHIVPLPSDISIDDALPGAGKVVATLEDAYEELKAEDAYLLFRDTFGRVRYVAGAEADSENYGSQYFRKMLASHFNLKCPWDWRAYEGVEVRVVETLSALRSHVAVS
jgi:diadenosine tetraphosphate (Ap4A) HIT family hydrolase